MFQFAFPKNLWQGIDVRASLKSTVIEQAGGSICSKYSTYVLFCLIPGSDIPRKILSNQLGIKPEGDKTRWTRLFNKVEATRGISRGGRLMMDNRRLSLTK
jgi:hypothetical protein